MSMTKSIFRSMRKVKTISVSLEPDYVAQLEALAKEKGSKSDALRFLLKEHQEREWDRQYREYYADPKNVKADHEFTLAFQSLAGGPEEPYDDPRLSRSASRKKRKTR